MSYGTSIGGGAISGAAAGSALGPIGTGAGALLGGLSGFLGAKGEEEQRAREGAIRAADQRAAPALAMLNIHQAPQAYDIGKNHGGDLFEGAINALGAYQSGQEAKKQNDLRDAMINKLTQGTLGANGANDPALGQKQSEGLNNMQFNGGMSSGGVSNGINSAAQQAAALNNLSSGANAAQGTDWDSILQYLQSGNGLGA